MTDATRAKVRAIAEVLYMLHEYGTLTCTAKAVRLRSRIAPGLDQGPEEAEANITTLARAHLPGVVAGGLVFDCRAGAALYAAMMERGS